VTFFSWLRLAYPFFRVKLIHSIETHRRLVLQSQLEYIEKIRAHRFEPYDRGSEGYYIHLVNLFYLFEYVLPALHDYGAALKLNSWPAFEAAQRRLFRFYLGCKSAGTSH
jgi:hypothetical protein